MKHQEILAGGSLRRLPRRTVDLLRSRANLSHLIYFMEHDRSLGATEAKIGALRRLLNSVEQQILTRDVSTQAHP